MVQVTRRMLLQASGKGLVAATLTAPTLATAAPAGKTLKIALSNS